MNGETIGIIAALLSGFSILYFLFGLISLIFKSTRPTAGRRMGMAAMAWVLTMVAAIALSMSGSGATGQFGREPAPLISITAVAAAVAVLLYSFMRSRPKSTTSREARMAPPAIDLPISSGPARLYDLPTGEFRFIALDVETANSDRSSICQIGLACVTAGGEITTFSTYVDPEDDFSAGNIRIHGITPDTVHGSPTWPAILPTLVPLLDRAPIVQHSSFDRTAVHAACEKHSLPKPNWHWHDSVRIARKAWPQLTGNGGHGLANLKSFLRLDFAHHDAGEDARAAAQVVLMAEIALGIDCLAPTPRRQPAKRATSARRRPLPETPTWRAAKRAIRNWNGDDPEDLLTAVAATSETLISSIEKDEISYREIVAISDFTSDLLDMIERHLDDAKADPDKSDVVLRVDIARGAAERLDDTVTDLLIEISGVKGRLSQSNP